MSVQRQNALQCVKGAIRTSNDEWELRSKLRALGTEDLSGLKVYPKGSSREAHTYMKNGQAVSFRGRVPSLFEIVGDAGATSSRPVEWTNVTL